MVGTQLRPAGAGGGKLQKGEYRGFCTAVRGSFICRIKPQTLNDQDASAWHFNRYAERS